MTNQTNRKSIYKKLGMVFGLGHILAFAPVPYNILEASRDSLLGMAGSMANLPKWFNGLNMLLHGQDIGDDLLIAGGMLMVSALLGLIELITYAAAKKKKGYILTLVFALLHLSAYGITNVVADEISQAAYGFYSNTHLGYLFVFMSLAAIITAIVGLATDRKPVKAADAEPDTVSENNAVSVSAAPVSAAAAALNKEEAEQNTDGQDADDLKEGILIGVTGAYAQARIPVGNGETIVIGRDPSECSIILDEAETSRKHCSVKYNAKEQAYYVVDYSTNGVFDKNGKRLKGLLTYLMHVGDEIRIGSSGEVFRFG